MISSRNKALFGLIAISLVASNCFTKPFLPPHKQMLMAIKLNRIKKVESLLDQGFNVNANLSSVKVPLLGWPLRTTPLLSAANKGRVEIVRLLLSRGAAPSIINYFFSERGYTVGTALDLAKIRRKWAIRASDKARYDETIHILEEAEKTKDNKSKM